MCAAWWLFRQTMPTETSGPDTVTALSFHLLTSKFHC